MKTCSRVAVKHQSSSSQAAAGKHHPSSSRTAVKQQSSISREPNFRAKSLPATVNKQPPLIQKQFVCRSGDATRITGGSADMQVKFISVPTDSVSNSISTLSNQVSDSYACSQFPTTANKHVGPIQGQCVPSSTVLDCLSGYSNCTTNGAFNSGGSCSNHTGGDSVFRHKFVVSQSSITNAITRDSTAISSEFVSSTSSRNSKDSSCPKTVSICSIDSTASPNYISSCSNDKTHESEYQRNCSRSHSYVIAGSSNRSATNTYSENTLPINGWYPHGSMAQNIPAFDPQIMQHIFNSTHVPSLDVSSAPSLTFRCGSDRELNGWMSHVTE
eukprot:892373_1